MYLCCSFICPNLNYYTCFIQRRTLFWRSFITHIHKVMAAIGHVTNKCILQSPWCFWLSCFSPFLSRVFSFQVILSLHLFKPEDCFQQRSTQFEGQVEVQEKKRERDWNPAFSLLIIPEEVTETVTFCNAPYIN